MSICNNTHRWIESLGWYGHQARSCIGGIVKLMPYGTYSILVLGKRLTISKSAICCPIVSMSSAY